MSQPIIKPEIRHIPAARRFELYAENQVAILDYILVGKTITFTHTFVPAELEGRGIGSQLARAGMEFAQENSYEVLSTCWFVTGYIERHKEFQHLLKA
jgi:predicted GNAT family acetyltransferase